MVQILNMFSDMAQYKRAKWGKEDVGGQNGGVECRGEANQDCESVNQLKR